MSEHYTTSFSNYKEVTCNLKITLLAKLYFGMAIRNYSGSTAKIISRTDDEFCQAFV